MPQFAVYRNKNRRTQTQFPFLVDVQADLLSELSSRVVIPLAKAPELAKNPIGRLTPLIQIDGEQYILLTPQLAGIRSTDLGPVVANLVEQRQIIIGPSIYYSLDRSPTYQAANVIDRPRPDHRYCEKYSLKRNFRR